MRPTRCLVVVFGLVVAMAVTTTLPVAGQESAPAGDVKVGYRLDVPDPISADVAEALLSQLSDAAESAPAGGRLTVVLRFGSSDTGGGTEFENALRLARGLSGEALRKIRVVAWLDAPVKGHRVLPVLAADAVIVGAGGELDSDSVASDETIELAYRSIARRRGLFPEAIAAALANPDLELARVIAADGTESILAGDDLRARRQQGDVVEEAVWSEPSAPVIIDAKRLRETRVAAGRVASIAEAAELLDLAELKPLETTALVGGAAGVLLDITGSVSPGRARRWQSNLNATLGRDDINTWLVSIDSVGGSLSASASVAGTLVDPQPPLRIAAGYVRGEARGDACLIAVACKPLLLAPEATIGGPGGDAMVNQRWQQYDDLIDLIAQRTGRPAGLIRGLLDTDADVYRFTNRRTGRVRYATPEDLIAAAEDPKLEAAKWRRGERIELAGGLTAAQAVSLGLADGIVDSVTAAAREVGLEQIPPPISDRSLVRFVEGLARSPWFSVLIGFFAFAALSAEMNAPGLGVPGFFALVCFALLFWVNFLAGTAEWLELVLVGVGLVCIGLEIFVVPGTGIFGIGGLIMTAAGLVLMSQTFVLPRNAYQLALLSRGVWLALAGMGGLVGGFIVMRLAFSHVPMFQGLIMEADDEEERDRNERLGDYSELLGQAGVATTPIRPSGKGRFGDQIIPVISDGSAIDTGAAIRVCEVHATRVVVELEEDA